MSNPTKPRATICAYDHCRTLVLGELFCYRHRPATPVAEWAIAAAVRDEQQDELDAKGKS